VVTALRKAASDEYADVRAAAAYAVWRGTGEIGDTVASLSRAVESGRQKERALQALGGMGPAAAGAVDLVVSTLSSEHGILRHAAAEALGKIGVVNDQVLEALIDALDDDGPPYPVCANAALALGMLGADAAPATRALAERLPLRQMETYVQSALFQIGPAAVPELRKMAKDESVPADLRKRVSRLVDNLDRRTDK